MAKITLSAIISASSKGLQTAMEKARAAVQSASARMKQTISSIGDAFAKPIQKSKELKASTEKIDGKAILSGLTGFAGKLAIIIAGFKAAGQILYKNWLEPIIMAKKNMADLANSVTKLNQGGMDKRMQGAMSKYEDLKQLATAIEANVTHPSAEGAYNIQRQQRRIKDLYGIDASRGNLEAELKKAYEEGRNQSIQILKGQIATLDREQESNTAFLNSYGGRTIKNMGEWDRLTGRNDEIKTERVQLLARIRELEKSTGAADTIGGIKARTADRADARRKKQSQVSDAFRAYEFNQQDTELQKKVRAAMEKYKQAIADGVDPARAKAAAERDIATAMNTRYKEYLDEVKRRAEAMKQARQKELDAQNALARAQRDLADAEKDAARERRRELEEDRKRKLTTRLNKYGFDASRKSPTRRQRKNAELDASIADKQQREASGERVHYTRREKERMAQARRMANELKRMDRADRKQQREDARQQQDRRTSNARKQAAAANMDATATRRQRQQAQRRMEALRGPEAVRYRLREQTRNVLKDYNQLTAPGIGGNFQALATAYTGQLNQIHTDLQRMYQRAFILR